MPSRRIYITLNPEKEKDKIIENYLSQSYSESDAIKEALYRLAINNTELTHITSNITRKVQSKPKRRTKTQKGAEAKSNTKVQSGAENTKKVNKVAESKNELQNMTVSCKEDDKGVNNSNKTRNDAVSNNKDNVGAISSNEINKAEKLSQLRQNELEELKKFRY